MPTGKMTVVYDACVLYPSILRDFLLTLAKSGIFRAKWTDDIQDEWSRNLLRNRPDLGGTVIDRIRSNMEAAIPDALVSKKTYRHLIEAVTLPDPGDRHVVAAAIASKASYVITFNLSDFPADKLNQFGVSALLPDEFVLRLIALGSEEVLECLEEQRARYRKPPQTLSELLAKLSKDGLLKSSAEIQRMVT